MNDCDGKKSFISFVYLKAFQFVSLWTLYMSSLATSSSPCVDYLFISTIFRSTYIKLFRLTSESTFLSLSQRYLLQLRDFQWNFQWRHCLVVDEWEKNEKVGESWNNTQWEGEIFIISTIMRDDHMRALMKHSKKSSSLVLNFISSFLPLEMSRFKWVL